MSTPWPKERHDKAADLWNNTTTSGRKIAEIIGVGYTTFEIYAYRNRDVFPKRGQVSVYKNAELIETCAQLWSDKKTIAEIWSEANVSDGVFRRMRKYVPDKFPKRDKYNRVIGSAGAISAPVSRSKYAAVGNGVNLKTNDGKWLHLSCESFTDNRALACRITRAQAEAVIDRSDVPMTMVAERNY